MKRATEGIPTLEPLPLAFRYAKRQRVRWAGDPQRSQTIVQRRWTDRDGLGPIVEYRLDGTASWVLEADLAALGPVLEQGSAPTRYAGSDTRQGYGDRTCEHCGCLPDVHHQDGRCYTTDEIAQRLQIYQRTGRWPTDEEVAPSTTAP